MIWKQKFDNISDVIFFYKYYCLVDTDIFFRL